MWEVLSQRLNRSGAALAVFEYLRLNLPNRLRELLKQSRRGKPVRIRVNDPAIVWDFFFQNGNLRRVGQLFLEELRSQGVRLVRRTSLPARAKSTKPYEIALSFAGEDRPFVEDVARELLSMGVTLVYDNFEQVSLLGRTWLPISGQYTKTARNIVGCSSLKTMRGRLGLNLNVSMRRRVPLGNRGNIFCRSG